MSNIIEKLGIEPLYSYMDSYVASRVCYEVQVRELEQQNRDMLEVLIDKILTEIEICPNIPEEMILDAYSNFVTVIEKTTGLKWQKIKELS